MIVTEAALREQLRHPTQGASVSVPAGAVLSPAARDFVSHWRLQVEEAPTRPTAPAWDRASAFTFDPVPCEGMGEGKPDHVTQLQGGQLAPKTHPRIRLRGRLDSLQALALLAGHHARAGGADATADHLDTVAAYVRELLAAEYQLRPAGTMVIDGLDEQALHAATHDPRTALGVDHLTPASSDAEVLLWCNWLRAQVREVELAALDAFPDPHDPTGGPLVHGLNRLSSAVYWVELAHRAAAPEVAS